MKTSFITIALLLMINISSWCTNLSKQAQGKQVPKISFIHKEAERKIEVVIDGKLFTSYQWPDNVWKPVLYPFFTSAGTEITRGFPIKARIGERTDHPHQIGIWFTYGNVAGNDFWGNGSRGLGTKNSNGGEIKHLKVDKISEGKGEGALVTSESWVDKSGVELLREHTEYHFIAQGSIRIIDSITKLSANDKDVLMPDRI